jgi:hypothetical protein
VVRNAVASRSIPATEGLGELKELEIACAKPEHVDGSVTTLDQRKHTSSPSTVH